MEIFYREKAFYTGKKIRKNDFAPSEKFSCYASGAYYVGHFFFFFSCVHYFSLGENMQPSKKHKVKVTISPYYHLV